VVNGVGDRVEIIEGEGALLGVNVGHPVVTNWDIVANLFSAALPKLLWDLLSKLWLGRLTCISQSSQVQLPVMPPQ